jgi:DNA-binding transcriptional MerR regulator
MTQSYLQADHLLTIGELAKRVGLRASALRYYEAEGLLQPSTYTEAGYRLYDTTAEQTLRLIQRAQRLGFTLADIRVLLHEQQQHANVPAIRQIAERRFEALERQLTPLLVLRHELALFLRDIQSIKLNETSQDFLQQLLSRVCADPHQLSSPQMLDWLAESTGCRLTSTAAAAILAPLQGQHIHLWQENDDYHILVVSNDPEIGGALEQLTQLEAGCNIHAHQHQAPELQHNDEGFLLIAHGEYAFLIARLFLSIEQQTPHLLA